MSLIPSLGSSTTSSFFCLSSSLFTRFSHTLIFTPSWCSSSNRRPLSHRHSLPLAFHRTFVLSFVFIPIYLVPTYSPVHPLLFTWFSYSTLSYSIPTIYLVLTLSPIQSPLLNWFSNTLPFNPSYLPVSHTLSYSIPPIYPVLTHSPIQSPLQVCTTYKHTPYPYEILPYYPLIIFHPPATLQAPYQLPRTPVWASCSLQASLQLRLRLEQHGRIYRPAPASPTILLSLLVHFIKSNSST